MKEVEEMEKFEHITEAEAVLLRDIWPILKRNKDEIVDGFYTHLEQFDELRIILDKYDKDKLKLAFVAWLSELFDGKYDHTYNRKRKALGEKHRAAQIPMRFILSSLRYMRSSVNYYVSMNVGEKDPIKAIKLNRAINKVFDLDLLLMTRAYARKAKLLNGEINSKFQSLI